MTDPKTLEDLPDYIDTKLQEICRELVRVHGKDIVEWGWCRKCDRDPSKCDILKESK